MNYSLKMTMSLRSLFSAELWQSDVFLSYIILSVLFLLTIKLFPYSEWGKHPLFHLISEYGFHSESQWKESEQSRAVSAYSSYLELSNSDISAKWRTYGKIGRMHKRIGYDIGYPAKLDRLAVVTRANAIVTRGIASQSENAMCKKSEFLFPRNTDNDDLNKVRECLRHFVRDWSKEGEGERSKIFDPILDYLRHVSQRERSCKRILVPGSGLGRLAWEISQLGESLLSNDTTKLNI